MVSTNLETNSLPVPEDKRTAKEAMANGGSKADSVADIKYLTGVKLLLCLGSITLIAFLMLLDQSILATAIPQITSQFHSLADVGWYSGAYQLTSATLQPLTGKLYTHLRTKHVFLVHLFLFEVGSLVCATATSSAMLIGGRALAGAGAAGLMNGSLTIISEGTSLEKRPLYTGILMGIGQLGIVTGPLIGGALTEHASWRWCFYINLPIGVVAAVILVLIHIPESTKKLEYSVSVFRDLVAHKMDLPGFGLFAPAVIMLLLALQYGGDGKHPWDSALVIGLLCGAGVTAVLFIFWESRLGERAMMPGALFKNRIMLASIGQTIGLMVAVLVGSLWLPMYFQAVKGASPTMSGVYVLPAILSQLLFAVVSGAVVSKLGYYLPWAVFSGVLVTIGCGLVSTFSPTTSTARWIGYLIVLGAGRGSGMQMAIVASQAALPPRLIPVSLAFLIFIQNVFAAIFVVVANTVFTQSLIKKLARYAPSVSPQAALEAGGSAEAVRKLSGNSGELAGILTAYNDSLRNIWYMLVAFGCIASFFAFGMGWRDVRKKDATNNKQKGEVDEGEKVGV